MRVGGFSIFERNNQGSRLWAAYHSPHSLTWRWLLSANKREAMPQWLAWHHDRHNTGSLTVVYVFWWAFRLSTQRPMWYRDLYRRARDASDEQAYRASEAQYVARQAEQARASTLH